jgi:threonylcarbamoyladenosine tRNA methylthiotransferase MtaB
MAGTLALEVLDEPGTSDNSGRGEIFCSNIFSARELQPEVHTGSSGRTRAIVKIQDGCNANCSFCVIPSVRGRSRSLMPQAVTGEIRQLVARGYKEVVLSGIHLGTYGRDLEPKTSFAELLRLILDLVPELERLRLSSVEPLEMTPEIVTLVSANSRLAPHFHVPLQSGSARILRMMRRPYSPEYYGDLTARIRSRIEDAAIGADVMVGFPGESDADFMETYRLIEKSPLTYLHVFPYSARPGTPAADLPFPVPVNVSRFRARTLRELIARKNAAFRATMVGRELEVLVLEKGEGLSTNFIRVDVPQELARNEWTRVRIFQTTEDGLQAVSRMTTAQETS